MYKTLVYSCALCALIGSSLKAQDSAVINFTSNLDSSGYSGVDALNPFIDGTDFHSLVNGLGQFAGAGSPDWLKFNGQIVINDFQGDGTYEIKSDGTGDGGMALMSPLLNRLEMESWRTEGPLTAASVARGGGVFEDGRALAQRDDIYVPDFTPNGNATVTISGNSVSVDYLLDFNTLPFENSIFLRNGDTDTDLSQAFESANARMRIIGVEGTGTAVTTTATSGDDDGDIPFGVFFNLQESLDGNLSNTIADMDFFGADADDRESGALTRGIIRNELAAGNITIDGRGGDPLADPFANEVAGTSVVTFFDLTGGPDFTSQVVTEAVPEPTSAMLILGGFGAMFLRRRR